MYHIFSRDSNLLAKAVARDQSARNGASETGRSNAMTFTKILSGYYDIANAEKMIYPLKANMLKKFGEERGKRERQNVLEREKMNRCSSRWDRRVIFLR